MRLQKTDELLVNLADAPRLDLDAQALDAIASTALRLAHLDAPREGRILTQLQARPYEARSEQERANMRAGVYRTIQALVLLGWIERP